jgi:ice-binding like protein
MRFPSGKSAPGEGSAPAAAEGAKDRTRRCRGGAMAPCPANGRFEMLRSIALGQAARVGFLLPFTLAVGCGLALFGSEPDSVSDAGPGGDSGLAADAGLVVEAQSYEAGAGQDVLSEDARVAAHEGAEGGAVDSGLPPADSARPPPAGPAPVVLATAGTYVILAQSAITNAPTSIITGDLGLSPSAGSSITGLALTRAGTKWTSSQVEGSVFAADNDPPTPSDLTIAVLAMQAAYADAAGRPTPTFLNLGSGAIGGLTLVPGLYRWVSAVTVPADVTLAGGPDDQWIFQITGNLTMTAATTLHLSGGAQAKNIVWQVAGFVDLGATAHIAGVILSQTAITLEVGASITGRLFAQTAVNIAGSTITAPGP